MNDAEIVDLLAKTDPVDLLGDGRLRCALCGATGAKSAENIGHALTCPWLAAMKSRDPYGPGGKFDRRKCTDCGGIFENWTVDLNVSRICAACMAKRAVPKADDPRAVSTAGVAPGLENAPAPGPIGANGQHTSYWVLSEEERAKGFTRPVRRSYVHARGKACGTVTTMGIAIAETYARDPKFYGATFCCGCHEHFPVAEFDWDPDGGGLGS